MPTHTPEPIPYTHTKQTIVRDRLAAAKDEIRKGLEPSGEGYVVLRDFLRDAAPGQGERADRLCRNMRGEALALFKCVRLRGYVYLCGVGLDKPVID